MQQYDPEAANASRIELAVDERRAELPRLEPPARQRRDQALQSLAEYAALLRSHATA